MTTFMTPSRMTEGQLDKAVDLYRAMVRKHSSEFSSDAVQQVLGQPDYVAEQVAVLRHRVEAVSEMIVRPFKIDRTKTVEQMISALGRKEYVNHDVLATMPLEGPDEGEMYFFPVKQYIPVAEQPAELAKRGLVPHPVAQIQVNIDNPSFADEHPNGVQWDGNAYAAFGRWHGGRRVVVDRDDGDWDDSGWFAGVRKVATE